MARPWYYEGGQGNLFNEWSLSHFVWGIVAQAAFGSMLPGLAIHTAYELAEGDIYPRAGRDRSMVNHAGDTLAFVAGQLIAKVL